MKRNNFTDVQEFISIELDYLEDQEFNEYYI